MCTVTLSYDQSNALARRKLAALLATGLFSQLPTDDTPQPTPEEVEAHRQEVELLQEDACEDGVDFQGDRYGANGCRQRGTISPRLTAPSISSARYMSNYN